MHTVWRSVVLSLAVAVALAAIALFVIFRWLLPTPSSSPKSINSPYVIGTWQGQVAVFEGNKDYPKQVFDVYVNTLPGEAQEKVQAGIPVENADQLSVLLEDYTG